MYVVTIYMHSIIFVSTPSPVLTLACVEFYKEITLGIIKYIVLNSRDWSEIIWFPEISHFKINLAIGFI